MKFGIAFANILGWSEADGARVAGQGAEAAGFDSLWTVEHVIYPDDYGSTYPYDTSGKMPASAENPIPDPLIWLTYVAACTENLRLGTGILILPQRNPVVLAKEVATLDRLSGGRVELGIGVGWLKEEFEALGIDWSRRGDRADEYIESMRTLWAGDHVEYHGDFVDFANISSNPKPANGESVRIVVGGDSPPAVRRAARHGDGYFPGKPVSSELLTSLHRQTIDAGRNPADIEVTAGADLFSTDDPKAVVEEHAAMGVHRMIVPSFVFALSPDPAAAMAEFGEQVIARCADIETTTP